MTPSSWFLSNVFTTVYTMLSANINKSDSCVKSRPRGREYNRIILMCWRWFHPVFKHQRSLFVVVSSPHYSTQTQISSLYSGAKACSHHTLIMTSVLLASLLCVRRVTCYQRRSAHEDDSLSLNNRSFVSLCAFIRLRYYQDYYILKPSVQLTWPRVLSER